ncbi:ABC transporter ATP-binding protein [Cohnella lupini]|uniref:NitT/TauT family transport system ATP-binding protein n=1 Tax=Cohnella lupini TaxID=1294267 RepID=A0A3D9I1J0_9BACL|nr:ABC transporter ATP-binding protein [Cohnella lupini]RED55541.1 NitT/TauT family transport system ATP-binding protein [Cohnella lupini]
MTYITVNRISKKFKRRDQITEALRDVGIEIEQGTFVSLIGPSGCGKSTLLRIIGGLETADDGDIRVGGVTPIEAQSDKQFGFVPQAPALFPWRTVIENMRLPFEVNRKGGRQTPEQSEEAKELLRSVGLGEFLDAYPKELSGGMQQRVGIVRAFASGAPILLMDEPFSALDEITREMIRYQLVEIWEKHKKTVVFVTHSIREAVFLSDKIVVMSNRPGRISEIVDVDLPRPRSHELEETSEYQRYVHHIKGLLRERWEQ